MDITKRKCLISLALVTLVFSFAGCAGIRGDSGDGGEQPPPPGELKTKINHIVLMMQENRSFDHYLGQLNNYRASKGLPADVDDLSRAGNVSLPSFDGSPNISPFKMNSECIGNLSPSWLESHLDMDVNSYKAPRIPNPMDGFAFTAGGFANSNPTMAGANDLAGARAMGYYDADQLPFYYWAATQFATSDRWFTPVPTRTQPNRMFFLAATSNGYVYPGSDGNHPPMEMNGVKNIFQLLEEHGITWKVYVTDGWEPGKTGSTYMNFFTAFTSQHIDKFVDATTFATDAANGTLPQVALIESGYTETGTDEHPQNPIDIGVKHVRSLVKALMDSPSWKDSVFLLTYDEGGGLYDHVPPVATVNPDGKLPPLAPEDPPGDFTLTGFRIPLFIFSPFAKPGYVSHNNADFTAFLKFIETRFDLPSLTARDAAQIDMTEFFDFSGTGPNLGSTNPPEQPDLPCYFDRLP